ncbi:MAG: beta-class carbonic anhydrase [Candidatus Dadabacteria bacterium]
MSENIERIKLANNKYSEEFGNKSDLEIPPVRRLAVLTCMDTRLEPMKFLGLELGDAHIIRNAGGRASDDAIRSLVISTTLLGTNEWLVIHHSECGMERFTQEEMGKLLKERLNTIEGEFVNWLSISDRIESVKHDVIRIRTHPLVSKDIKLSGYLFDIKTGELQEVITL